MLILRDSTVKTRIKEPLFFEVRLAKVLKIRSFNRPKMAKAQTVGRGRGNVIRSHFWKQYNLLRAIFASQNHFYSKWVVKLQARGS